MQHLARAMRQVRVMAVSDMEVAMRRLLTGSWILMAAVALLATGCEKVAEAPTGKTGDSPSELGTRSEMSDISVMSRRGTVPVLPGDVAEVVVTAERPAWLMPEVVTCASQMPEVVVYASRQSLAAI